MTQPKKIVLHFEHVAHTYAQDNQLAWPSQYGVQRLDALLSEIAADAGDRLVSVRCGDSARPGLLTLVDSKVTIHRLGETNELETLSFGRLTEGRLIETRAIPQQSGTDVGRADMVYTHPALEPIGGYFTIDLRYTGAEGAEHIRDLLAPLIGSPV